MATKAHLVKRVLTVLLASLVFCLLLQLSGCKVRKAVEHNAKGEALWQQGRFEEAIVEFQQAIDLVPTDAEYHDNLGLAYSHAGQYEQAVAELEIALRYSLSAARKAFVYSDLGYVHKEQGEFDKAIEAYTRALQWDPEDMDAQRGLAASLAALKRYEDAIDAYRVVLQREPLDEWKHYYWGLVYYQAGEWDKSVTELTKAVALHPEEASGYSELGRAYKALGKIDEAIVAYEKAMEVDPSYARPHTLLGFLYLEEGLYEDARKKLEAAVSLSTLGDIEYNNATYYLARLSYLEAGGSETDDDTDSDD